MSLTDEETVLKKAITLTPNPEAENYNSGYLTTCNGNNRLNYKIQVNSENNQNQFELSANKKTWTYQLDTSNLANRTFLQHVNPSLAVALEIQEALRVLANDDKIQAVLIRRQKNNDNNAISVYSKEETTTELTVLIPSSSTDSSLQSVLSASQEIRIEKTYISDSLRYKLSFSNDDADAKAITITQIIDSTGKIQVQTTQKHPVKVFSDTGIITHHSNRVSSETIEVEYNDYLEDATFTYHTGGQLIISNLIEGMKVEHYAKPPIQNIVNGVVESFIILKPEDKIVFLNREQNKLEQFLNNLLSVSNFQSNQDLSLQEEASINPELKLTLFRGKYGGIKNGQVIILFMISHAHGYFSEGLAPVMFNNKWGYVNTQGEMFIACQFESAGDFSEGLAPVMLNNKWGYVNTQGIIVIPCQFEDVKEFSEELAPVRLNDKWGYVNTQGEIFISCKFEDAETFSEGLAAVQGGYSQRDVYNWDKWGYINKKGKVVISFEFIIASHFSNGVAYVRQYIDYARGGLIDKRGEWIAGFHFDNFSEFYGFKEGLALVAREGKYETKYGFISARGKLIIPCEFDSANEISEGFASVKKDGKWGFIDKVGRVLKEPQFDGVGDFSEGLAPVKKDGKWGYIDRKGYEVIWYQFDDNGYFSEGLAKVHKNGKWGYIDKTGKLVIPYQFDEAYGFQEGLAKVIVNEQEYLIDKSQTIWVSESDYDKITIQMP
ncbi:hypothetical protein CWATWH0402_1037 [Crocosphaera watsonii WH 0402]|uniref:WG repeat-containing protein n=1 Tax=Crocosphaera watsonii WH 0402 TaxID=1284629 RepID=T2JV64_CROWT|nr:hypothetical protein CWATWH0402_1037 [Crocosphaera watsonii WH 0402]